MKWMLCAALSFVPGASALADNPGPPAVTKPATERVRLAISIDKLSMSLKSPPRMAAFVIQDEWAYGLAIDATDRAPGGATTVSITMVPKATDPQSIKREQVVRDAKKTQVLTTVKDVLLIEPGKDFPSEYFGVAPPKQISISLDPGK